jgi:hypothetical protein
MTSKSSAPAGKGVINAKSETTENPSFITPIEKSPTRDVDLKRTTSDLQASILLPENWDADWMKRRISPAVVLSFAVARTIAFSAEPPSYSVSSSEGWKLAAQSQEVAIYSRLRSGSALKEFRAVGEIGAATHTIHAVIDDLENYPSFMPYTAECRVIRREENFILTYQRLSPKLCADRDYTLRIRKKSWPAADGGRVYLNWWRTLNSIGPEEKPGVVRVEVCDGGWLLEPEGANKTRATYSVYTDTGGFVPAFLANRASQIGIGQLFEAVRKQARNPKYRF